MRGTNNLAYDVFLSYARQDTARAEQIKIALEGLGLTVFFDVDGLDGGDVFPEVLSRKIAEAGATLSLWNTHALTREWVRHEIKLAQDTGNLIPVEIGLISDDVMTVTLSRLHRLNLTDFDGHADHRGWQDTVRSLARTLKRPDLIKARKKQIKVEEKAAKLEAELKAERQQSAKLRNTSPKKGLGWRGGLAMIAAVIIVIGAWSLWMLELQEEHFEETRLSGNLKVKISELDLNNIDLFNELQALLETVPLARLERVAEENTSAALLAGYAYYNGVETDYSGIRTEQDRSVSAQYWQTACDGGNMLGCTNLGILYENGEGVNTDLTEAARLYEQACDGLNMHGCAILGTFYEKGIGIDANPAEALYLYTRACDGGNKLACRNLTELTATPNEAPLP